MFSKRNLRLQAVFVVLLSLVALGARDATVSLPSPTFTPGSEQVPAAGLPSQQNETPNPQGPGERRGYSDETGKLSFVGFAPTQAREVPGSMRGSWRPQDHAMASLILYGPEFGVRNPLRDMQLQRVQAAEGGRELSHYQQTYQGVPVLGGELAVNTTSRGQLLSISGEVSPDLSLSTQPHISAEEARETALGVTATVYDLSAADLAATEPELWIFDERLLRPSTRPAELVWRMDVSARDAALPIRELVLVNAETGGVSLHFNQIDTAWASAPPDETLASPDPAPLQATITVSTTDDDNTVNGNCTLREAIIAANTDVAVDACAAGSGDDVIDLPAGTYVLSVLGIGEDAAATGDLDIASNLSITGAGSADTILDGDAIDRIFDIVAGGHVVSISNLTIRNGNPNSGTAGVGSGAAIRNRGSLTVSTSLLIDNYTWVEGGAIGSLTGDLTINDSIISGNRAGHGGGIYFKDGLLTLNNTTVSDNEAGEQGGNGGGILTSTSSTLVVNNVRSVTIRLRDEEGE